MLTRLAVRLEDVEAALGRRPFLALPREEIARLRGAVEVHAVPASVLDEDGLLAMGTFTVIHRNYNWHVFGSSPRVLGIPGICEPADHSGIFLDDDASRAAIRSLDALVPRDAYELRAAGILFEHAIVSTSRWLRLVYVARLRRPLSECGLPATDVGHVMGTIELQHRRHELDAASQVLVDHLAAL